jgi:hypothetical protein
LRRLVRAPFVRSLPARLKLSRRGENLNTQHLEVAQRRHGLQVRASGFFSFGKALDVAFGSCTNGARTRRRECRGVPRGRPLRIDVWRLHRPAHPSTLAFVWFRTRVKPCRRVHEEGAHEGRPYICAVLSAHRLCVPCRRLCEEGATRDAPTFAPSCPRTVCVLPAGAYAKRAPTRDAPTFAPSCPRTVCASSKCCV